MKTRKQLLLISLVLIGFNVNSQLRIDPNGRVAMGTNTTHPSFATYIKGNMVMTDFPQVNYDKMIFKVGNGHPGAEIGGVKDGLAFWTTWTGHNIVYAQKFQTASDRRLKADIIPIQSGLEKIMTLKPYKYNFISTIINENDPSDSVVTLIPEYGFLSQEVEKDLPEVEITEDSKGIKLMDYQQIIPVLVAGMQEQQKQIDKLQSMTAIMMATNSNFSSEPVDGNVEQSRLLSSSPNPFTQSTELRYKIIVPASNIEIKVFDITGIFQKSFKLESVPGEGSVELFSNDLSQHGRYVFALFIDGVVVDAKTVILE